MNMFEQLQWRRGWRRLGLIGCCVWLFVGPLASADPLPPSQTSAVTTQIAAGRYLSCALDTNGNAACWGNNDHGQLGAPTPSISRVPVTVPLSSAAVALATGGNFACALHSGGGVDCWGANGSGQLGDGTTHDRAAPQPVAGLPRAAAAIVSGEAHTCALDIAGAVSCWGANESGQLGNGSFNDSTSPLPVAGLDHSVTALAAGARHTCALTVDGRVLCWGDNGHGQLGSSAPIPGGMPVFVNALPSGIVGITAGGAHTCALTHGGSVYCWGNNSNGQLGDGTLADSSAPVAVAALDATSVAAGNAHTCAISSAQIVYCWGDNDDGELGDGTSTERLLPTAVVAAAPFAIGAAVSTGYSHTCVRSPTGGVLCWGSNGDGELGNGSTTPNPTPQPTAGHAAGVIGIAGNATHFCLIASDSGVQCWGPNLAGELGNGTLQNALRPTAVIGITSGVEQITAGPIHSCAVLTDGSMQCWGSNHSGQLGNGTLVDSTTAVGVQGLPVGVRQAAASNDFTCALLRDGRIACWGANSHGQLGNGTTTPSALPVLVKGLSQSATAIAAGSQHVCAILADGSVSCWGYGAVGQLGNGNSTDRLVPTPVIGLPAPAVTAANALVANFDVTCVVSTTGGVMCWGINTFGSVGNGSLGTGQVLPPTAVAGLTDAQAIGGGAHYICAARQAGGAACWGEGDNGQLGNGTRITSGTPTPVQGLVGDVIAIAGSYSSTCAVHRGGDLSCWGANSTGELGFGYLSDIVLTPKTVLLGQTLAFRPPVQLVVGQSGTSLTASATSGLTVTFDTWTPDTCTVVGNTVVAIAPALCGLRASQSGDGNYAAAPQALYLVPVVGIPHFAVTKSVDRTNILLGGMLTYTIVVSNTGTDVGTADLSDSLPTTIDAGSTTPACTTTGAGAACQVAVQCRSACALTGSVRLPPGGSATIALAVRAAALGDATNSAVLTPTSPMCGTADCGGGTATTATTTVAAAPWFAVTKSVDGSAFAVGDTVHYRISISNQGTVQGTARLDDSLPIALGGATFSCTPSDANGSCDTNGSSDNRLQGSVALSPGSSSTFEATATVTAVGDITNTAYVVPTTPGCDPAANGVPGNCGGGSAHSAFAVVKAARVTLQTALGGLGRLASQDQFVVSITAGSSAQVVTTGVGAAITSPAATLPVDAGSSLTLNETMASGSASTLDAYVQHLSCSNALAIANGGTDPSSIALNSPFQPRVGDRISCLVTNTAAGATVALHATLNPVADPGRFDLLLDGNVAGTGAHVGNGGASGVLAVDPGTHTIGEAGSGATALGQYSVNYTCFDSVTQTLVASGAGATATLNVGAGQHLDCTLQNTFAHSRLTASLTTDRQYQRYGRSITYLLQLQNTGGVQANGASVASALAPALDPQTTTHFCLASVGATCAASGSGALSDSPTLMPGASVAYIITAPVSSVVPAGAEQVVEQATVTAPGDALGTQTFSAATQLVIFRDSYEPGGDGAQWNPSTAPQVSAIPFEDGSTFDLSPLARDLPQGALVTIARLKRADGRTIAEIQAVAAAGAVVLRATSDGADGSAQQSAWLKLQTPRIALLSLIQDRLVLTADADGQVETTLPGDPSALQLQIAH